MLDALDFLWPLGGMAGIVCVLVAFCTANVEKPDMVSAYKWAPYGALLLFAADNLMWLLRVQHYWPSLQISN
jgi:hypothetical protein